MSRVLIADDNKNMTLTFSNFLTKEKNIEIIGIVNNGVDALNTYFEKKPDVLLLDLDMPKMNGLEVIEKLSNDVQEKKKNNIIVISGALEKLRPYNTSQVYRVMQKPIDHSQLLTFINEIQDNIDDEILEIKINEVLAKLKITDSTLKGTDYLKKAIFYCYKNDEMHKNITLAYEQIARDYFLKKIKPKNVLWSLESLIDVYDKYIDKRFLNSFFLGYDFTKNLTPKYLVDLIVTYLKSTLKNEKMVE